LQLKINIKKEVGAEVTPGG